MEIYLIVFILFDDYGLTFIYVCMYFVCVIRINKTPWLVNVFQLVTERILSTLCSQILSACSTCPSKEDTV